MPLSSRIVLPQQAFWPYLLLLIIALAAASPAGLRAQITCTGEACAYLPLSPSTLDSTFQEFKRQYTDQLFNDMAEAGVLANLGGPPIGTVNLSGITVGGQLGVGYVPVTKVDINVPGAGYYKDVPRAGGAVSPRMFLGVNLGWLFASSYDSSSGKKTPSYLSPARFDLYISGIERAETIKGDSESKGDITAVVYGRGGELRYHIAEGNNILLGPMLRFRGVSVGVGSYHTRLYLDYDQRESKVTYNAGDAGELEWTGKNRIHYETQIETYPVDVKTGIQLLYFLNLTVGAGVVWSKGTNDFSMTRSGPVYLKNDLASALGYTVPSAVLSATIIGTGSAPARLPFAKAGIEFNIAWLKIAVEGIWTKRAYGANLGVRVEI